MKRALVLLACLFVSASVSTPPSAGQQSATTSIQKRVENYLRDLYAWDSSFDLKVQAPVDSPVRGLLQVPVAIIYKGRTENATLYVSQDGRFLLRGELNDMSVDPFADARPHLHIEGNPSIGPADASVVVVAFSDFQCPHCRLLYQTLKAIEPSYPQVRFVFKDFPLQDIHPWAMTAAIAGRCAYLQNPQAFWKVHDAIFDNQDAIQPGNAWDKMLEFGSQAGLDSTAFRTCMSSPAAKQAVQSNIADGTALHINSTPTVYINGRPLLTGERELLEQYIKYELNRDPAARSSKHN